jgi:hypothetical protein
MFLIKKTTSANERHTEQSNNCSASVEMIDGPMFEVLDQYYFKLLSDDEQKRRVTDGRSMCLWQHLILQRFLPFDLTWISVE